jgi:hypothetical protein
MTVAKHFWPSLFDRRDMVRSNAVQISGRYTVPLYVNSSPSLISAEHTELCCVCGCDVHVPTTTPIGRRADYVASAGQLYIHCR